MYRRVVGAVLLLIIGVIAIVGTWYLLPRLQDRQQRSTSDAGKPKALSLSPSTIGSAILCSGRRR